MHFQQIERELSVAPTEPAVWGGNNRLMHAAAAAQGISAGPTVRNAPHCRGSARCQAGCPFGAKQSMLVTYLPHAERRGAVLITGARAERVRFAGDRAVGVEGHFQTAPFNRRRSPFRIRAARAVIVAASAVQTPGLLRRSGVRSPHLGAHFQAHPGTSIVGIFDRSVDLWSGATQGYEVNQYRRDGRFKIETISLPPELLFASLPGVGHDWRRSIAQAPYMAAWGVQLRAHAEGSVGGRFGGTTIRFDLTPRDITNLKTGLCRAAELLFAAGAREVLPGVYGVPARLTSPDEVALIARGPEDPRAYTFILSHLFGTARMSVRAGDGVVGDDFAVHGTRNLYVVDSSIFPSNTGVNPQHSIMAIAMQAANTIAER